MTTNIYLVTAADGEVWYYLAATFDAATAKYRLDRPNGEIVKVELLNRNGELVRNTVA